ncbi:hypothetical protein JVU11DRAFT_9337 [Chiua virens]|nr:hypothetical protein JVU11DRAFT_9337 [Chiua virens]
MTTLRHFQIPSSILFPFSRLHQYEVHQAQGSGQKYLLNDTRDAILSTRDNGEPIHFARIPPWYCELVLRFLYRGDVLRTILMEEPGRSCLSNQENLKKLVLANLIHWHHVIQELGPAFESAANANHDARIPFFDMYMLRDHYVGRQDPAAAILWQMRHPEVNLRTDDPHRLDWDPSHFGPTWDGSVYLWDIGKADRVQLMEQAFLIYGEWFEDPYPLVEAIDGRQEWRYAGDVIAEFLEQPDSKDHETLTGREEEQDGKGPTADDRDAVEAVDDSEYNPHEDEGGDIEEDYSDFQKAAGRRRSKIRRQGLPNRSRKRKSRCAD